MLSPEEYINSINIKLQQLLKNYAALKKENVAIAQELKVKNENEKNYLAKINHLEIQTGILKASAGTMNEEDQKDFEKRINQYIKELDKCIAILNN